MVYNKEKSLCKHYSFDTHKCFEDDSFCSWGYPMCLKHCSNGKYEPLYLPAKYVDLVLEELRG